MGSRGPIKGECRSGILWCAHREDLKKDASIFALNFREIGQVDEMFFAAIAAQWADSSVLMSKIAQPNNAVYVHVLQPNQHYTRHRFGAGEKAVDLNIAKDNAFVVGAHHGYPALLNAISKLMRGGFNVYSAVDIFDVVNEPVYGDQCCHYNALGESLLAEFIAVKVIAELCQLTKSASCH
jgi:hypothetical protein